MSLFSSILGLLAVVEHLLELQVGSHVEIHASASGVSTCIVVDSFLFSILGDSKPECLDQLTEDVAGLGPPKPDDHIHWGARQAPCPHALRCLRSEIPKCKTGAAQNFY